MNFSFLTFFAYLSYAKSNDLNIIRNLVKSTLEFYKSQSVVLVVDDCDQNKTLDPNNFISLQKMSSSTNLRFSSLTTLSNFSKKLDNIFEGVRETVVILEPGEKSIQHLEKEFNKTNVTLRKWLLTSTSSPKNFDQLKIPLNSELIFAQGSLREGYNLSEIYEVEPERKLTKALGRWVYDEGFQLKASLDLFTRRKNLEGALIKIISPKIDNCAETSFAGVVANIVWCINQEVWDLMAEMINATTEITVSPNLTIETIRSADAHLTFRSAPVNSVDLKTRSFVWPLFETKVVVVTSYAGQQVEWRTFLLPFSKEMWTVILMWVLLCDFLLAFIEFILQGDRKGNCFLRQCREYSFVTTFTFCSQGVLGPSRYTGILIIFLMIFIVPSVIFPGYSAILTSFLTVYLQRKPFSNLEGLSRAKDYQIGWHRTFPLEQMFNLNDMSPLNQALLKNVLPQENLPATELEGIEKMCDEKFAFLSVKHAVMALEPKCKYFMLPKPFRKVFTSMEMKKNMWYKYFLDRCERTIDFSGVLIRIKRKVTMKHLKYSRNVNNDEPRPISMENIVFPFAMLLVGVICSVCLLITEVIHFKIKSTARGSALSVIMSHHREAFN